jgi:hypothetical protein
MVTHTIVSLTFLKLSNVAQQLVSIFPVLSPPLSKGEGVATLVLKALKNVTTI